MVIERGEIYWFDLNPVVGHEQSSRRPAVVVSANSYNRTQSRLICIVPLTKSEAKTPLHVPLSIAETGLTANSTALTDHLRFVDRSRINGSRLGRVRPEAMIRLNRQIARLLGLLE